MANVLVDRQNDTTNNAYQENINNQPYRFNVTLITDGRSQQLKLGVIKNFVIEDTVTDFYQQGYIVIDNTFDALERSIDSINSSTTQTDNRSYLMRGDSRDLLIVDIMPFLTDNDQLSQMKDKNAELAFKIAMTFCIYNTEEIPGDTPGQKFKKLYFWDMHYELLTEKNSYFSTANYAQKSDILNLDDSERTMFTGDAIKAFLTDFFKEEDNWPITINEEIFDSGASSIFFSAPARWKGIDCLNYLLNYHASSVNNSLDQAFLRVERHSSEFTFESLASIFKKALADVSNNNVTIGSNYLETLKLGTYSDASQEYFVDKIHFTPLNALFFNKSGVLNNFSYDPMPGEITQQDLASIQVHSYEGNDKQFQIEIENNHINSTLSAYKQNYVNCFNKANSTQVSIFENIYPGQYRADNKNTKHVFSVIQNDPNTRLTQGRNKALFNSIFMNSAITFRVPGLPHRQAGHFIGLDFNDASATSKFNKKLLGIYFVVEVRHIFSGNEYFNEMRCVKTYNYDNLFKEIGN